MLAGTGILLQVEEKRVFGAVELYCASRSQRLIKVQGRGGECAQDGMAVISYLPY